MGHYSLERVSGPVAEPISLAEVKLHLGVITSLTDATFTAHDGLIAALLAAAREKVESITGLALVSQVWRYRLDCFPLDREGGVIRLPKPPLIALSSFQYVDTDGAAQSLLATDVVSPSGDGDFDIDYYSVPARLSPAYGKYWPTARATHNAITIQFEAGYPYAETSPLDHAENVPAAVKAALKLMIAHWYEHREEASEDELFIVPFAAQALLDTVKAPDFRLSHA